MALLWKKNGIMHDYADEMFAYLQKNFGRAMTNFLDDRFPDIKNGLMAWRPHVDLKETDKEYILRADMPGVEKKDLSVALEDNVLTIKGERKAEEKKGDERSHWTERFHGKFARAFSMPDNIVDQQKIEAKFDNGVLTVMLKKKSVNAKRPNSTKHIEIK